MLVPKPLFAIDHLLIELATSVSRSIYRWIGIGNFGLSKVFLVFSLLLAALGLMYGVVVRGELLNLLALLLWVLVLHIGWKSVEECKRTTRPGFGNIHRIHPPSVKFRLLMVFVCLLSSSSRISEYAVFGMYDWSFLVSLLGIMCFTGHLYFKAVDPEDPTESKLKKGLRRLKEILSPNPLPSPA